MNDLLLNQMSGFLSFLFIPGINHALLLEKESGFEWSRNSRAQVNDHLHITSIVYGQHPRRSGTHENLFDTEWAAGIVKA
jgi:hypothetical protein